MKMLNYRVSYHRPHAITLLKSGKERASEPRKISCYLLYKRNAGKWTPTPSYLHSKWPEGDYPLCSWSKEIPITLWMATFKDSVPPAHPSNQEVSKPSICTVGIDQLFSVLSNEILHAIISWNTWNDKLKTWITLILIFGGKDAATYSGTSNITGGKNFLKKHKVTPTKSPSTLKNLLTYAMC